uniref:Aminoacyl-tRNA hydrolase n=1 Tax=Heterorhabditis bacteriophora TaxID=37862 RepID=A0A1I7X3A8_HETBA
MRLKEPTQNTNHLTEESSESKHEGYFVVCLRAKQAEYGKSALVIQAHARLVLAWLDFACDFRRLR